MSFLARYASVRAGNPAGAQYREGTRKRRAGQPKSGCGPRQVTCTMYANGIIRACQAASLCAMIAAHQKESFSGKKGSPIARPQSPRRFAVGRGIDPILVLFTDRPELVT